jgi:hypothetical protein
MAHRVVAGDLLGLRSVPPERTPVLRPCPERVGGMTPSTSGDSTKNSNEPLPSPELAPLQWLCDTENWNQPPGKRQLPAQNSEVRLPQSESGGRFYF